MTTTTRHEGWGARLRAGPRTTLLAVVAALALLVGPGLEALAPAPAHAQDADEFFLEQTKQMLHCARTVSQYSYEKTAERRDDVQARCNTSGVDASITRIGGSNVTDIWKAESGSQILFIVGMRGTNTSAVGDGILDAASQFAPTETLAANDFRGVRPGFKLRRAHRGFTRRAKNQWNGHIERALRDSVGTPSQQQKDINIMVTGHSLGSAAAVIVGAAVKSYMEQNAEDARSTTVVVPFNPPKNGTTTFVNDWSSLLSDVDAPVSSHELYPIEMSRKGDPVARFPVGRSAHVVWNTKGVTCKNGRGYWSIVGAGLRQAATCMYYRSHAHAPRVGSGLDNHSLDEWEGQIDDFTLQNMPGLHRAYVTFDWGS